MFLQTMLEYRIAAHEGETGLDRDLSTLMMLQGRLSLSLSIPAQASVDKN